ncbi:MAG: 50S ribosomal protein L18e [Candidatus Micrarchaeota archaeon]|nr:50S ribosomal protein L18e [Candidatus Micrarchaeota archaeon]
MPKPTGPTNPVVKKLIEELRTRGYSESSKFMIRLAELLGRPRRRRVEVNLAKIERHTSENETVVVPGKVLGYGYLTKPVTISALSFSKKAREKIKLAGGKAISIQELVKNNPRGSNVRVMA